MKAAVIVGATATGKSALALEIAGDVFQIISADSVQVYRHMNIGSCKPDCVSMERIRHHLVDIVDPDYPFTAGEFVDRAYNACSEIETKGCLPLFVGGTGFYIDAFFKGLSDIPPVPDNVRIILEEEMLERGPVALHDELLSVDGESARRIHPHDRQRILRALAVYRSTGKPMSEFMGNLNGYGSDKTLYIGLDVDRAALKERINTRVDDMIRRGLVDEVRNLRAMGYGPDLRSMQSIGYAEIHRYLDGKWTLEDAVHEIKKGTYAYAKRQATWFFRNKQVRWFLPEEIHMVNDYIGNWLETA